MAPSNPDFPPPEPEALSQQKPQLWPRKRPHCGPCKEPAQMWLRQWWGLGSAELSRREVEGVGISGCFSGIVGG